jgi:hypothetical protein
MKQIRLSLNRNHCNCCPSNAIVREIISQEDLFAGVVTKLVYRGIAGF